MKRSWKIAIAAIIVAIIALSAVGVVYANSNTTTTDCQPQSLCIFQSATCNSTSKYVDSTAVITNGNETVNFIISNDYPGYNANVSFTISNKNCTPGVVSSITYINPNPTYFTMTPIVGIVQGQTINANSLVPGSLSIDFNPSVTTGMGKTYTFSVSIDVTQYVPPAPPAPAKTSTCLTSSPNPSDLGQSIKFTANVNPNTATGNVTFYDGNTVLNSNVPLVNGSATINVSNLTVGSHSISASYNGNSSFASSTSNTIIQKVLGKTTITWPYKPNPCNFGQSCTFSVQVGWQGPDTPTGYVTFNDGANIIGTCNLSNTGIVTLSCYLSAGSHNITAIYSGDNNNDGNTSDIVNQTVNKVNSTITLVSSPKSTNSKTTVTFTATVIPSTATGVVVFKDGNTTLGMGTLNGGKATFSTSLSAGIHSITAVYSGDENCNGSTSTIVSQVITK